MMISRGRGIFKRRRGGSLKERAAAIVEFAVVLPILLTILFGIIEYGWIFMIKQTLQTSAREGCRIAILQTTTAPYTDVLLRVGDMMATTGMNTYTVEMTHATVADPVETITVSIPFADVSLMGGYFGPRTGNLTGSTSMRKEGM